MLSIIRTLQKLYFVRIDDENRFHLYCFAAAGHGRAYAKGLDDSSAKTPDGTDVQAGLKRDGWIGPKTTNAFTKVAKKVKPLELAETFGKNLGFL